MYYIYIYIYRVCIRICIRTRTQRLSAKDRSRVPVRREGVLGAAVVGVAGVVVYLEPDVVQRIAGVVKRPTEVMDAIRTLVFNEAEFINQYIYIYIYIL